MQKRCAIYTRKSTDEGLEQEFNSLDAQREACEAYIKSQQHEGWRQLNDYYDDGGISGGTMDRPALKRLLDEVKLGRVDIIVVYKVDRLTRALSDFAKMVDLFDRHNVSFVSVTQQFNTTTSMGRLTLNVLLSFAQFEREVTAERIRDKIAASMKKGMWMGGCVPLGYDNIEKKLVVNKKEAEDVKTIFDLYLQHKSVRVTKKEMAKLGIRTKRRVYKDGRVTGDKPFWCGNIYSLLQNPIYKGMIRHKDNVYAGLHEGIVDSGTWEAVQKLIEENRQGHLTGAYAQYPHLLTGMIYDEHGIRLIGEISRKKGRVHRYYASARNSVGKRASDWRLPAQEIEAKVKNLILKRLLTKANIIKSVSDEVDIKQLFSIDDEINRLKAALGNSTIPECNSFFRRWDLIVSLNKGRLDISLDVNKLLAEINIKNNEAAPNMIRTSIAISFRRRGVEKKIIIADDQELNAIIDNTLIKTIADAQNWWQQIVSGKMTSVKHIAEVYGTNAEEVTRTLPLAFLSPKLVENILRGQQPAALTSRTLKRITPLPTDWSEQQSLFNKI